MNNATTYPVRNNAPLLEARGALRRVLPDLRLVELQEVPQNSVEYARFLWGTAQVQAHKLHLELQRLEKNYQEVQVPFLIRQAHLNAQRDEVQQQLSLPLTYTGSETAELQRRQDSLDRLEDRQIEAEAAHASALAAAGMTDTQEFNLSPDETQHLGSERGFFCPLPTSRVWGWAVVLPGLLIGPALWTSGLEDWWRGLGLPDQADAAGILFCGVIGIAIAHTLKAVLENLSAQAAQHDAARRGVLPSAEQHAHYRRWSVTLHLITWFLVVAFAFIEAHLVQQALSASDPSTRLSEGTNGWLTLIGALVALTPASLLGVTQGRQKGYDAVSQEYRARSRHEALKTKRAKPEVQLAILTTTALNHLKTQIERAQGCLEQVKADALARHERQQAALNYKLRTLDADLNTIKHELLVLEADYGRRCEQAHQQADQSTQEVLDAFKKLSSDTTPGFLGRLRGAFSTEQVPA